MSSLKKYTRRPVEISAILYDGSYTSKSMVELFLPSVSFLDNNDFIIPTLEGDMRASVGDYIVIGVEGEMYACKPEIFKKTYDPVDGVF